jgi:hypothetical protein
MNTDIRKARMFYSKEFKDSKGEPCKYRRNGATKEWKRDPNRFQIPVKRGLYEHGYINQDNTHKFTWE